MYTSKEGDVIQRLYYRFVEGYANPLLDGAKKVPSCSRKVPQLSL